MTKIHEQLKAARLAKGWSQEEMARRAGMTLNNYSRIERGVTGTKVSTLERIADVLGMRLELREK